MLFVDLSKLQKKWQIYIYIYILDTCLSRCYEQVLFCDYSKLIDYHLFLNVPYNTRIDRLGILRVY